MENSFLREILFVVCFALVGYQIKTESNIECNYQDFIASGKLKADIYGLAAVLTDIDPEDTQTYDEVIKYFIAHGCDIHQKLDIKKFMTEYGAKYGFLTGKYAHKSEDEIQKLIQQAEEKLRSNILTRFFSCFNHGIMTYIAGIPNNPYLAQALIKNNADIKSLGGILNFCRYSKDYEFALQQEEKDVDIDDEYKDTALDVAKNIYQKNSYINRAIMYVLMSKKMYQKISE